MFFGATDARPCATISRARHTTRRSAAAPAIHLLAACAALGIGASGAQAQWSRLTNNAPGNVSLMLLLSDGTVMAQEYAGAVWHRLTPDSNGSYLHGVWDVTPVPPMANWRKFFSSAVLRDGRLFAAGGEYGGGNATSSAEIFDPLANGGAGAWSSAAAIPTALMNPALGQTIGDSECVLLPNGDVLLGPTAPSAAAPTLIYHVASDSWSAGPAPHGGQDEASWVKLPDNTILTADNANNTAERYDPVSNTWIVDAGPALPLYQAGETGPAIMLPNGKAFFLGGLGFTGLYTPSGTNSPGSWTVGPNIPSLRACGDAPCAMMVNGNVLCVVGDTVFDGGEGPPVYFYEYRTATNDFSPLLSGPTGGTTDNVYASHIGMVMLPDGNVLYSHDGPDVYIYTPSGPTIPQGIPTIWSVSLNPDGSHHLIGTGLNGFSAGCAFGDDFQMDTNYPLVRLTGTDGHVHYCRTYDWSSTGVSTGSQLVSTEFTVPAGLAVGNYELETVVNGFAAGGWSLNISNTEATLLVGTGVNQVVDPIGVGNDNGNGLADPGENSVELYVQIEDLSFTSSVTSVNGTLTSNDPYVTVISPNAFYNDLAPLASSSNLSPFVLSISRLRPCGTPISLTLTARSNTASGTYTFTIPTGPVCTPPADAPANDACTGALVAVENQIYTGDTSLSTTDGGTTCAPSTQDVWYRYTATATGYVNINTCGSGFDTVISIHSGCPGTGSNQLACNDDSYTNGGNNACGGTSLQSGLTFGTTGGATYYIRIAGYNGASGAYVLAIIPIAPANDLCSNAIEIGPGTYSGTTGYATTDGSAGCGFSTNSPDVWYAITPALSGLARLDTCSSSYDTTLSLHTGCPGNLANQIGCNDDAPPFTACYGTVQSVLNVPVTAGHTYYLRVSGFDGASGDYTLHYSLGGLTNDTCPDATPVWYGTFAFNTTGATTDGPTEANCNFCCGDLQVNQDIWFSITPTCGRAISVDTLGSTFDTKLAAYAGCPVTNNTAVACNDDVSGTVSQSAMTLHPIGGTTYYIRVGGYLTAAGPGVLHIKTCLADFNCSGAVTVQDIFDFLNAWFARLPTADFNNSGTVTVQDIFDFLTAWFAGC